MLPLVEGVLYEWLAVCIATLARGAPLSCGHLLDTSATCPRRVPQVRLLLYYADVDEKACPPMARYLIRGVRLEKSPRDRREIAERDRPEIAETSIRPLHAAHVRDASATCPRHVAGTRTPPSSRCTSGSTARSP